MKGIITTLSRSLTHQTLFLINNHNHLTIKDIIIQATIRIHQHLLHLITILTSILHHFHHCKIHRLCLTIPNLSLTLISNTRLIRLRTSHKAIMLISNIPQQLILQLVIIDDIMYARVFKPKF